VGGGGGEGVSLHKRVQQNMGRKEGGIGGGGAWGRVGGGGGLCKPKEGGLGE